MMIWLSVPHPSESTHEEHHREEEDRGHDDREEEQPSWTSVISNFGGVRVNMKPRTLISSSAPRPGCGLTFATHCCFVSCLFGVCRGLSLKAVVSAKAMRMPESWDVELFKRDEKCDTRSSSYLVRLARLASGPFASATDRLVEPSTVQA